MACAPNTLALVSDSSASFSEVILLIQLVYSVDVMISTSLMMSQMRFFSLPNIRTLVWVTEPSALCATPIYAATACTGNTLKCPKQRLGHCRGQARRPARDCRRNHQPAIHGRRGRAVWPGSAFYRLDDIFLYPGRPFRVVDGLLTNFHLPESSLIMLVSALAGRKRVLAAYAEAVSRGYRFFSYGYAMLIR